MHSTLEERAFTALQRLAAIGDRGQDLRAIGHQAAQNVLDLLAADFVALYLLDQSAERLTLQICMGADGPLALDGSPSLELDERWIGIAVRSGQPFLAPDIPEGDAAGRSFLNLTACEGIRSGASFPLWEQSIVTGVIAVAQRQRREFTPHEVGLMTAMGRLIGSAIHRARLLQETEARGRLLAALSNLGDALASDFDLSQVLQRICQEARAAFDVDGAILWLRQESEIVGRFTHVPGEDFFPTITVPISEPYALGAQIVREGKPRLVNRVAHTQYADFHRQHAISAQSMMGVPLKAGDKVLGALVLLDGKDADRFCKKDLNGLSLVGNQAALALKNAHLSQVGQSYEERYRNLTERSLVGVYIIQDDRLKFISPQLATIFGYTAEELATHPVLDVIHPDDRNLVRENLRRRIEGEVEHLQYNFRALRKDGQEMAVEVLGSRILYEGKPAIQGTLRDITEQRRAEADVRRFREFNERIVQGMEEGVIVEDTEGHITFANPKMEAMLGYGPGELTGFHWHSVVPESEWARVQRQWDKRPRGVKSQYDTFLLTRSGSTLPVIISSTPLFEGDRYIGVLSAFTDITRRKRAEETLHGLNAASVLMQGTETPEAVYQAGAHELARMGLHSTIAWLDEAQQTLEVHSISNLAREDEEGVVEAFGTDPRGFSFPVEKSPAIMSVLRDRRAIYTHDLKHLYRQILDGAVEEDRVERAISLLHLGSGIVAPLSAKERILGILLITSPRLTEEDLPAVTAFANQMAVALENARLSQAERERTEALERAYAELKELDRLKDEFVQNVSHELRTPVTFIRGYVDLMLEGILGPLTSEQRDALHVMANRTESLVNLVNDIIFLKRAEMASLELESLSLTEVACAAVRAAEVVAEDVGLTIVLDASGDIPPIRGDRQRLGQVFDNLLSNAIKFSNRGGEITVRIRPMEWGVRTEVIDQGIGIPADQLDRVWERFYQVDGTSQRRFSGTGLGLAIVKRIVEAHGGLVGVESTWGESSVFSFALPYDGPA